jgi:hypothetical protein
MWNQIKEALAQSTAGLLTLFASLLPRMAALILAVLISVIIAIVLAALVRRLLFRLQFEELLARWGFASLAAGAIFKSPSLLVSRTIAGLVVLAGFLVGITAFNAEWTSLIAQTVVAYIPKLVTAMLVLLAGSVIARFLARSVLIGAVNMNLHYARLVSVGVKWLVLVLTVAMTLEHLRIAPGIVELAFGILFGGIVLALALAVGLGSKEMVSKSLERDVKEGPSETIEDPLRHL